MARGAPRSPPLFPSFSWGAKRLSVPNGCQQPFSLAPTPFVFPLSDDGADLWLFPRPAHRCAGVAAACLRFWRPRLGQKLSRRQVSGQPLPRGIVGTSTDEAVKLRSHSERVSVSMVRLLFSTSCTPLCPHLRSLYLSDTVRYEEYSPMPTHYARWAEWFLFLVPVTGDREREYYTYMLNVIRSEREIPSGQPIPAFLVVCHCTPGFRPPRKVHCSGVSSHQSFPSP